MHRLFKVGVLCAFLTGSTTAVQHAKAQSPATTPVQSCDPIGRITQGAGANFRRGQIICSGTTLTEPQDNVEFLCFSSATVIPLTGDSITVDTETCDGPTMRQASVRSCNRRGLSRLLCFIPKGPSEQFQVIAPDALTISTRPAIAWESIETVTGYTIRVNGPGIDWERTVEAEVNQLTYPETEASLVVGNAYEVLVIAYQDSEAAIASKVINVQGDETITLR